MVEEVPRQNDRFGIHRRLLDCSVRAAGIGGLRGQPGGTGATVALRRRPKTDVLDAQWIQRLHSYGLLRASFRPPDSVLALRAYWRQRQMQVRYAASHVQHMQKAMEQMNVKLTEVVSDITGVTGMSIIGAILEGERDPVKLAKLRDKRCHPARIRLPSRCKATWRPEHLFELRQARDLYQFHHRQITECDQQIEAELAKFPNRAGEKTQTVKPRKRGRKSNDVRFEATGPLFQALGVDLTLIEGIDVGTALVILAEIGVDVSRFPTEKHFASWLRLCPPQDESNKTKKRRGHRKGTNRVTIALRMAARSAGQDHDAVGPVLPPHPQSDRRTRSSQGDRAQVGVFGLPDAQVRPGVRHPVDGRVRGQGEGQDAGHAEAEGGGDGLPTESAAHAVGESIEAVAIARQACGHAQR